jgi:ribosomal RNA methyltransferase Nop2
MKSQRQQQNKTQIQNKPKQNSKIKKITDEISEEEEEKDNIFGESDLSDNDRDNDNDNDDNQRKVIDEDEEDDLKEFGTKKDEEEVGAEGNKTDDLIENMNLEEINLKIQHILNVLSDLKQNKEEGMSRSQYMDELKRLLMVYYDYNDDIMTLILYLFHPSEAIEFLESSSGQRVMSIRTNTLKTKRRELAKVLINRGVNLDPLAEWTKVGLKIYDSTVPVGATPEYLSGHYMLQSGSSFLPVIALDPQENEKILDMSAAPGGKTTYIAQLMKNTGVLVANDLKKERLKSLYFNVHRLGVKNCIITNYDGKKISKLYNNFDRVLLDAPCSGLGVISKDPSVKVNRTYKDIIETTRIQKELLLSAIDCCCLKNNIGVIVYSTCSISVEENEWVVDYALKHRYVKLVELSKFLIILIYIYTIIYTIHTIILYLRL